MLRRRWRDQLIFRKKFVLGMLIFFGGSVVGSLINSAAMIFGFFLIGGVMVLSEVYSEFKKIDED